MEVQLMSSFIIITLTSAPQSVNLVLTFISRLFVCWFGGALLGGEASTRQRGQHLVSQKTAFL